ncbi:hypothetical protein [Streptomyces globisporus]|uniref:hypothetical protein n=1 Tax=Streptomyces globisporus TaxID=1908 RepID=UPI00068B1DD1|nr:hypothetical protein [Streptomyces globisporus]
MRREHDTPARAGETDAPPMYPGESTDIPVGTRADDDARENAAVDDTREAEPRETERREPARRGAELREAGSGAEVGAGTGVGSGTDVGSGAEVGSGTDVGSGTEVGTSTDAGPGTGEELPRLLDAEADEAFRTRWHEIQSRFVDDPRGAVHEADELVNEVIRRLAATFADRKKDLEGQWSEGEDVDTEDLRTALRQYRSFFNRLLTT